MTGSLFPSRSVLAVLAGVNPFWVDGYRTGWAYAECSNSELMELELRNVESCVEMLRYHEIRSDMCAHFEGLLAGWNENGGGTLRWHKNPGRRNRNR